MSLTDLLIYTLTSGLVTWFLVRFVFYKIRVNAMMKKVAPLPGELPIIGHGLSLLNKKMNNAAEIYNVFDELTADTTEDKRFWIMNFNFIIAVKERTIQKILTSPDAVEKSYMYSCFAHIMGGIFAAPTNIWRRMRKRLNMMFNPKFFPNYIDQMNYQSKVFLEQHNNRNVTEYQDILPAVSKYFFDLVTSTHMGLNSNQQYSAESTVAEEISKCTELVYKRLFRPWLHIDALFNRTKLFQRMKESMTPYTPFLEKLASMSAEYQERTDTLGNMPGWKPYTVHLTEFYKEMRMDSSPKVIGEAVRDVLVAASDTAAVALSYLLYQLGNNSHYQDLAYKEVMSVFNDQTNLIDRANNNEMKTSSVLEEPMNSDETKSSTKGKSKEFIDINNVTNKTKSAADRQEFADNFNNWTFTSSSRQNTVWTRAKLDRLQYSDMLIKESLRLTSPPILLRYLTTDIDTGEYTLPKGSNVGIITKTIQRNPLYWEKPNEFYPDHFKPEIVKTRSKYTFLPFSHGPRDCPGKVYGMYGLKCLFAEIISNYVIKTKPRSDEPDYKLAFMIEQTHGYPVKLIPRNN